MAGNSTYTIIRNNQTFGPFTLESIKNAVEDGKLLKNDQLYENDDTTRVTTIRRLFKQNNIKVHVKNSGTIVRQLGKIGRELLLPKELFSKETYTKDKRLMLLALVGLSPLFLMFIALGEFITFYAISLYFSVIWGMFFYSFFKTKQVKLKITLSVFFLTQVCVFLVWGLGLNQINFFYFLVFFLTGLNH